MLEGLKLRSRAMGLQFIFAACLLSLSGSVWSETAAADEAAEIAAAGKIIQAQQGKTAQPAQANPAAAAPPPEIADDMADGKSIRALPTLNEPVIDQANLLSAAEKQAVSRKILQLHESGKAQVGIIIVPTTGQEDIFSFAMRAAEQWQLGSAKQENGLLMAVAVNDRRMQILSGYGLEGVLPDIVLSRIIRNQITPYFKQNQYAQGIQSGLDEIEKILNMDPEVAAQAAQALQEQQAREKTFSTALFILIAGIIGSYIFGRRLSAAAAAVAGVTAGLVNGAGLLTSLLIGGGIFFLLITALAQLIFQALLSSGRGRGGGSGGGGGYRGGGGGFGGGGASGSW